MRKQFKIMYPADHADESKRGQEFKLSGKKMIVMNSDGIFFVFGTGLNGYSSDIQHLSHYIEKFDVVWI